MMRKLVGLLLVQLCAGLRSGKAVPPQLTDDSCTCLSWKDVYANGDADCGDAFEFATYTQLDYRDKAPNGRLVSTNASTDVNHGWPSTPQEYMHSRLKRTAWYSLNTEFCDLFLFKVKSNTCIKVAPTSSDSEWFGQSWCYVSSKCQSLNGGVQVEGRAVSAKMCTEKEDDMLSEKSLMELAYWAETNGVIKGELPLIVKLAYDYVGEDYKELEESPYNKLSVKELHENEEMDEFIKQRLMTLKAGRMKGGVHLVYDYQDYNDKPKYVIYGNSTHRIWNTRAECIDGCAGAADGIVAHQQ
jgi:hypothetical protein